MNTRMAIVLLLFPGILLTMPPLSDGAAQQLQLANPSFEFGEDAPEGWLLPKGDGLWLMEGASGDRSLGVIGTGQDKDANFWLSSPITFRPDTTYRLRFDARHVEGAGGSLFTGPVFHNRDLPEMTQEWRRFTTYFKTPPAIRPGQSRLRFGQWNIHGIAAFDAVELVETLPVYRRRGALVLGDGEHIQGNRYTFIAPFAGESTNHSRPLFGFDCYFNKPRWVFAAGDWVVYRHEVGATAQQAAELEVTIGHYSGGTLDIEVSQDGERWLLLGDMSGRRSKYFVLPEALFPTEEIWVRLSARERSESDQAPDRGGSLQVYGYQYAAELARAPGDLSGTTRFLSITDAHEDIHVSIHDLGQSLPGENLLHLQVENTRDTAVTLEPLVVVHAGEDAQSESALDAVTLGPGKKETLTLAYDIPGIGDIALALDLGTAAGWRGETSFYVSPLHLADYGALLPDSSDEAALWWAASGWKVSRDRPAPTATSPAVLIQAARNEREAAQVVCRPSKPLRNLSVHVETLRAATGETLPASAIEIHQVAYVHIAVPTDNLGEAAPWPDPLPAWNDAIDLDAGVNQPVWIRVNVPKDAAAGLYTGAVRFESDTWRASAPLEIEVFDFTLPDRMTCQTAFGFNGHLVNVYHGLNTKEERRLVFDQYADMLSSHHISPYELGEKFIYPELEYTWPNLSNWDGGKRVAGAPCESAGCFRVMDDDTTRTITARYNEFFDIPESGLHIRFDYRTETPGQDFLLVLLHYTEDGMWLHGQNNHIVIQGDGAWNNFESTVDTFPEEAAQFVLQLNPALYVEDGSTTGTVWFDAMRITSGEAGAVLLEDDFSPYSEADLSEVFRPEFKWRSWETETRQVLETWHFNSFILRTPGLGSGAGWAQRDNIPGTLLGYSPGTPEYSTAFNAWYHEAQERLRENGWLEKAFIYWFDEPIPEQYDFVMKYNQLMKDAAPDLQRMLTEKVAPELIGGPNLWCPISYEYDHEAAEARRAEGDRFWWYICTGPKAPYATLFIDHPATELRVWLWQTWQRDIEGILVWALNWWTSDAAYPDSLQNPYADPMSWCHILGDVVPVGARHAWGNGDGRFMYPPLAAADGAPSSPVLEGPVGSIRLDMLRDGIEDYEYLVILKNLIDAHQDALSDTELTEYQRLLEVPDAISASLTDFTWDPTPIEAHREAVARAIERLAKTDKDRQT